MLWLGLCCLHISLFVYRVYEAEAELDNSYQDR